MLKIHNLKDRICGHRDNGGHATEIPAGARLLFCNGQVGSLQDGTVPDDVSEQVDIIFDRIAHILEAGRMGFGDIAKVSVYVTDAKYFDDYYEARPRYMGDHNPPTVLLVVGPFPRPGVQMEVEVLAAKVD
jgi:enamine deaminase RidA (YjgF/YER057c/UK114 family)